ncbi:hypothetical protein ACIP2Y_39470 [Streptomyces sviceus]|uniref:hypothetical protein n=1 Tax=Streptomyces sviceus TaxID=285530 RepID=UPI00381B8AD5
MSTSPDDFDNQSPSPAGSVRARDHGVRRSRRLTRWIAVAAVTGAAALGSLYTHLLPGSSASPAPSSPPRVNPATSNAVAPQARDDEDHGDSARHENDDGEDDGGAARATRPTPQPPAQPPAPTQQQPHTTTGAS